MLYHSKIDERAARLRAGIPALHKPPPQDYANLIEHRRRARVAENRQMEEGIAHDNGIQKRVQLLNAATERHRLEGYYRLGQVPAHILHPIVRGLTQTGLEGYDSLSSDEEESMEVDDLDVPDPRTGLVIEMGSRDETTLIPYEDSTQANTVRKYNLPSFTDKELLVKGSAEARAKYPEAVASRNAKITERNVKVRKDWKTTDARKVATAKKQADAAARKEARDLRKRA